MIPRTRQSFKRTVVRLATDEEQALVAAATLQGKSRSQIFREALRSHLNLGETLFTVGGGWPVTRDIADEDFAPLPRESIVDNSPRSAA